MNRILRNLLILALGVLTACAGQKKPEWAIRMADSEMQRFPDPALLDFNSTQKWGYTQGLVCMSMFKLGEAIGDEKYIAYADKYLDEMISDDGSIRTYRQSDYNLDQINSGKVLLLMYQKTGKEKYAKALSLLREQIRNQPRTSDGGFWHKNIYPHQMWLDGIYMASPFLAMYGKAFNEPEMTADAVHQVLTIAKHNHDEATGLFHHGWDESRTQFWCDTLTGRSSTFWGRSIGWYGMAIVEILDIIPADQPGRSDVIAVLQGLADAIVRYQDPDSKIWWEILDQGTREGNYLEASVSAMFVYTLARGVNQGYLDAKYMETARQGFDGLLNRLIKENPDGTISITQCCSVGGLGGSSRRDGSFEYYISEPVRDNDAKATGPFILAAMELSR